MFKLSRKSFNLALCLAWVCLTIMTGQTTSIEIVGDEVIQVVENGTEEYLVLDCPYELSDQDKTSLVIKWYHTNNPVNVYQWIHGNKPQAIGILEDRLDLEYVAKDEEYHRHRALYVIKPTTELSGEYTCSVSSFEDEKTYIQKLIVYSKPSEVSVWTDKREEDTVTVICKVDGIYPEPELMLHIASDSDNKTILAGAKEVKTWSHGSYMATIELEIDEDDLDGPVEFVCEVAIPDTDLVFPNATKYEPMMSGVPRTYSTSATILGLAALLLCLL
ncbi:uncharacterized protein LOC122250497 isoform X2 [Penaeus japonicus]|uniref:uncharacterized protein LOC122250497 isoform X2 n=1 Tax=Penaeus japonicus TaxID=27405 RepID=UPI001C70BECA|nr:uncharacterized protein LOC122250497 isoform X2 [Penaeus japonicus]